MRPTLAALLLIGSIASLEVLNNGCKTIVDFGLKNATFELYDARSSAFNFVLMEFILSGYKSYDPAYRYMVHFLDNDVCTGDYYAADTLSYHVEGTWKLIDSETLFINLDHYVNGSFHMQKLDHNTFLLSTDENILTLFGTDTIPLEMHIRRTH